MTTRNTKRLQKFVLKERPRDVVDWVNSYELYHGYRFRKRDIRVHPTTGKLQVRAPYISKTESSDHEFALTFSEWQDILETYWNVITESLFDGDSFTMPRGLGTLEMVKYKGVCNHPTFKSFNFNTMGYRPKVIWNRKYTGKFLHKTWYTFNLSRKKQWKIVGQKLKDDPSQIFNLKDS